MTYDNFPSCCNLDLLQKYRAEFVERSSLNKYKLFIKLIFMNLTSTRSCVPTREIYVLLSSHFDRT